MVVSSNNSSLIEQAQKFLKSETDIKNAIVSVFDNTGIAGFRFNITKSESVELANDITDYYTDNNSILNDHIARKPVFVTVTGLQGEYFYSINELKDLTSTVGTTMKLIEEYKPQFNAIQNQLRTKWNNYRQQVETINRNVRQTDYDLYDVTSYELTLKDKADILFSQYSSYDGVDLFQLFQDLYKFKSSQTRAYLFFEVLRMADKPFTVETRWKRFKDMYIQKVSVKGEDTADITEISVQFKQLKFANSQIVNINAEGRTQKQYWKETNKGIDNGTKVETIKESK